MACKMQTGLRIKLFQETHRLRNCLFNVFFLVPANLNNISLQMKQISVKSVVVRIQ
jgi:hypothetical protein